MDKNMTAAVLTSFGGPEALQVRDDVSIPNLQKGQVLVQVTAASVNNTDIWTREGAYGQPGQPNAKAGWRGQVDFPRVQGADIVGRICAVGDGVDQRRLGERVLVDPAIYDYSGDNAHPVGLLGSELDGGFAQYVAVEDVRAHNVTTSPLNDEQLACLPTAYGTAMGMLERAEIVKGDTIVVTGASGGVGFALVQLASIRGARVIGMTTSAKGDLVAEAGADVIVNRKESNLLTEMSIAAPSGLDAVADVVGGESFEWLLPLLKEGERWVIAGAVGGPVVTFDLRRLYLHNKQLIGSSMHTPLHFRKLIDEANAGRVLPRVAETFTLNDIHKAQQVFQGRRHVGKIVILPSEV
ncbi:zinc-binding dehydrogenase [Lentibacillus jeotgali]|uniref:zinc-binding dehydrogenase n=1 Tax=Lentibacillus jeotgali TaxID=558169 RepID=UPI0002627CB0|nr:zinc-binding dehydrogenase [Lentibacillus jeotgali]